MLEQKKEDLVISLDGLPDEDLNKFREAIEKGGDHLNQVFNEIRLLEMFRDDLQLTKEAAVDVKTIGIIIDKQVYSFIRADKTSKNEMFLEGNYYQTEFNPLFGKFVRIDDIDVDTAKELEVIFPNLFA